MNKNHQVAYQVVDEINDVTIGYKFTIKEAVSSARDYLDTFLEDEYTQVSIIKYRKYNDRFYREKFIEYVNRK